MVDDEMKSFLGEQKRTVDIVPDKDEHVFLRATSNLSQGGDSIDYTDKVHHSVLELSLRAIQAIPGLEFAGIDFMSTDITAPQAPDTYRIIEVNSSPGFAMHDVPYEGVSRYAARSFLELLFPDIGIRYE